MGRAPETGLTSLAKVTLDLRNPHIADPSTSVLVLAEANAWPTLIFLAGSAAVLLPFLVFQHLPMVDYANHLARLYILSAPSDDPLRQMYVTQWTPIPDLGMDLLYAGLRHWLAPETVIRLGVALSAILILGSVYIIQKALFGRISYSATLAPLFVHGLAMHMGYLNYLLGAGLAFAGFAFFFVAGRKLTASVVAILSGLGVLIYVCHIAAFAAYVVILGTLSVYPALASFRVTGIRAVIAAVVAAGFIAAPAALLYLLSEKPAPAEGIVYSVGKLRMLGAATLASPDIFVDKVILIGAIILLFAMRRLHALSLWRAGVPVLLTFLAVIVALPNQIDRAIDVDSRLVLFLVFLSLSMLEAWPLTVRARAVVGAAIIVLIAVRMCDVMAVGAKYEGRVAEFQRASAHIHPGDKVLIAEDTRTAADCSQALTDLPTRELLWHMGSYLTIDRRAFIPLIFAGRGMQPIRPADAYVKISTPASVPLPVYMLTLAADPAKSAALAITLAEGHIENYFVDWRDHFDAIVVTHHGCAANPLPDALSEIGRGSFFAIYRLRRG